MTASASRPSSFQTRSGIPIRWPGTYPSTLGFALLFMVCAPADLLLLRRGADEAAWGVMILGMVCAMALAYGTIRADKERHRKIQEAERLHAEAYQRASTSIWVEDWSEVGRTIGALRRDGHDPAARFVGDPALVRRLHDSVRILDVNDATVTLLGAVDRAALVGRLVDVVPASVDTFDAWLAALARGDRHFRSESRVHLCGGAVRDCLVTASLPTDEAGFSRLLVSILDVTDYKADQARLACAEREVARVSRLLTVGVLTGSIAHEVNNPLAATITNAEAALRWLGRPEPDRGEAIVAIEGAIAAACRARDVVDRTRRLVTSGALETQAIELPALLDTAAALLARELRHAAIDLRMEVEPGTPRAQADPVQMQQVLINLLQNAIRAMRPDAAEKLIVLSAAPHPDGIYITVRDNGVGVPAAIRNRLFEPFSTTRAEGMGLGLAVCKACVEAHGGRLWLDDTPGEAGAAFRFTLPEAARP